MRSLIRNMAILGGAAAAAHAGKLDGRWSATVEQAGITVPFRLDIATHGDKVVGTLYNGEDTETTTSASIADGKVDLQFKHYLTSIKAVVKNDELDGVIV